jgi:cephalosporin-C deacetylase-like acetyl esterase
VDFSAGTADIVWEQYPDLAGATLGEVRTISYQARDNATIPAYVTIPPGVKPENLPLVVLPHGGPEARDYPTFDWQAQFLATRGYAVLQPQFRGSTGFGEEYRKAGYRQWGGVMQNDITDGVKALIEQGLADPRRICIFGASYGGYAALAGAAFTPGLYACAVSVNGISDLPGLIGQIERRSGAGSDALAMAAYHIGSPFDKNVIEKCRPAPQTSFAHRCCSCTASMTPSYRSRNPRRWRVRSSNSDHPTLS